MALLACAAMASAALVADVRELSFMTARRVSAPPSIDGSLDDGCWSSVCANDVYYEYLKQHPGRFKERATSCTVVYDAAGVYVGIRNAEPEVAALRRNVLKNRDPKTWMDDCAEIYFDPNANGIMFYRFVVNANGVMDTSRRMDAANFDGKWTHPGMRAAAKVRDGRWELELFVPWTAFGLHGCPASGTVWTFDHNRFIWLKRPQVLCCSSSPGASYASPEKFGYLLFTDGTAPDGEKIVEMIERRLSCDWGIEIDGVTYLHDESGTRRIDKTLEEVSREIAAEEKRISDEAEANAKKILAGDAPVAPLPLPLADRYDFSPPREYDGFNGHYRHNPRLSAYVPPHPPKRTFPQPPRVLFMTGFGSEIRDMAELANRFSMDAMFFPGDFGQTGIYSDFLSLGTFNDKDRQFQGLLARKPDVFVFRGFAWKKVPAKYRTEILRRVRDEGAGLLFLGDSASVVSLAARDRLRQLGKGRILATDRDVTPQSLQDASPDWVLRWRERYERRAVALFAAIRRVQGFDDVALPPAAKAAEGRAGRLDFVCDGRIVPEDSTLMVSFKWQRPLACAARLETELRALPHGDLVKTGSVAVAAGAVECGGCVLESAGFPALSGFVRARLVDDVGEAARSERVFFFPNHRFEDYTLVSWGGVDSGGMPHLMEPQLVGELGYRNNLGASGFRPALFNCRAVPYAARVMLAAGPEGETVWGHLAGFTLGWGNTAANAVVDSLRKEGEVNPNDPRVERLLDEEFPYKVTNTVPYGVCVWSLGDECGLSYDAGLGRMDKAPFAEFLRMKYGSVGRFNAVHGTNIADFADAPHRKLSEAESAGDYPAWWDHVQYMDKMYADTFKKLSRVIKRYDPRARVGAEGSMAGDLEQTVCGLEFWGPYRNMMMDEVLRNIAPGLVRGVWWGGYPDDKRDGWPAKQWEYVLTGVVNADLWFQADPGSTMGCVAGDLSLPPYLERMLPHLKWMRRGVAQLLDSTPFRNDGFALFYSYASVKAAQLDGALEPPESGFVSLVRFCYRKGYDVRVVPRGTLDRLRDVRVLFLPGCSVLFDDEAEAIAEFAKRGGLVVCDCDPGVLDGFFARRPAALAFARLRQSLTCRGDDERATSEFDGMVQSVLDRRGIRPHEKMLGAPSAILRVRESRWMRLVGYKAEPSATAGGIRIELDRPGWIYDVDNGFVGFSNVIQTAVGRPLGAYAVFGERQLPPSMSNLREGGVYRIAAFDADGHEIVHRTKTFRAGGGNAGMGGFFVPLDERAGTTYRLRDVATGLESALTGVLPFLRKAPEIRH